ncbi:hypothetical protein AtNW77_Chr2g0241411 [Arabidopsis thaliana]|uniref:Uncharacterized protein n=2 Tax=Arabidopsis TaxID=3701 RepID=A0A178W1L9_ARATH|nr:hypothetical protein ISN45_At02g016710 [Arabidopsis thaliana x Arabidopsis arenosa]OAP11581.1 hypothetical protein AXX17_AT2G18430 [Arabidopsis thaliana]
MKIKKKNRRKVDLHRQENPRASQCRLCEQDAAGLEPTNTTTGAGDVGQNIRKVGTANYRKIFGR